MGLHMKSCCFTQTARGKSTHSLLKEDEEKFIQDAVRFLDHPGFLVRLANKLGKPLEIAVRQLPARHQKKLKHATQLALQKGLKEITKTIPARRGKKRLVPAIKPAEERARTVERWHTAASFGVGAAGGFFGLLSLPIELPLTTAIILRSIAAIAAESGMDLDDPQVQLECLYILSLGSPATPDDDTMTSAYWTSRAAFAQFTHEAAAFLAKKTGQQLAAELQSSAAPMMARFLARVAARYEFIVSEKLLAEALPIVGALGGGVINATFTNYFSQAARFHFGLRALENKHGRAAVEQCYNMRRQ
jgi:hypothetical protein